MSKLLFSLLAFSLILISCSKQPQKSVLDKPMFTYEKTACMGACPVYKFLLYKNGNASYIGKSNVSNIGSFERKLTEQEFSEFKNLLKAAELFNYEDSYRGHATDLPTTKISYTNEDVSKNIIDYYGAPESLKETEKQIEKLINAIEWK